MKIRDDVALQMVRVMDTFSYTFLGFMVGWMLGKAF